MAEQTDQPLLSQEDYVAKGGTVCPRCGSDELDGGFVEVDEGKASQPITCTSCGASWSDTYQLVGYSEITLGDKR